MDLASLFYFLKFLFKVLNFSFVHTGPLRMDGNSETFPGERSARQKNWEPGKPRKARR